MAKLICSYMTDAFRNLLISARPRQWIKNVFVFAALLFVKDFYNIGKIKLAFFAFIFFCLASSAVYFFNDICDISKDRRHPFRKSRPLAAGQISILSISTASALLGFFSLAASFYLDRSFGEIIMFYIILNILYSLIFKKIIIVDIIAVALGFVLRVVAGAVIIGVPFSIWLILCTFFLALFITINKRKSEYILSGEGETRSVLRNYSAPLLDQMSITALVCTLISYTFYTFSSEHSRWFVTTVPLVMYGLFYYLATVLRNEKADNNPSEILFREYPLQAVIIVWVITVFIILAYGR